LLEDYSNFALINAFLSLAPATMRDRKMGKMRTSEVSVLVQDTIVMSIVGRQFYQYDYV